MLLPLIEVREKLNSMPKKIFQPVRKNSVPNVSTPKMNTSWGGVADWYNEMLAQEGTYQKEVILPNLLRLVAPKKGDTVLDIGCGTGFFSRAFAEAGAKVIGADVGAELIAKANKMPLITYHVAPSDQLPFVADGTINKAVMVLSLQNMENAPGAIQECARTLALGGSLFVVLNHPVLRVPSESSWGWDEKKTIQYRRLDRYMSEKKIPIQMHPGDNPKDVTWSFHRPLQYYFKAFAKHGLAVTRLEEWVSHTKTPHGPRAEAENRARTEFPVFMCLEARKIA